MINDAMMIDLIYDDKYTYYTVDIIIDL